MNAHLLSSDSSSDDDIEEQVAVFMMNTNSLPGLSAESVGQKQDGEKVEKKECVCTVSYGKGGQINSFDQRSASSKDDCVTAAAGKRRRYCK